jgi:sulfate-transporting ATPase
VPPKALQVCDVTVRFGTTLALSDVTFRVAPGEVVGLIGPNGAGKTTLIDAVTGFVPLAGGDVAVDGASITGLPPERRARLGVSRSFQSLELFEDSTVLDNIRIACDDPGPASYVRDLVLPRNPDLPPEVVSIIQEFDLAGDLDTEVQSLPFGKRHLLALARAVASRPSILLLDEPAAGLSDAETMELVDIVRRLAADWGMAVLLIEHDMNFVMAVCDRLVVLDFGKVIATGTPDEIQHDPVVLAAYLGELDEPGAEAATLQLADAADVPAGGAR